jgi:Tfp pilus assembly protein PilX
MGKKGIALYLVLAILIVVVILANVFLSLVVSQSRLSTHEAKRVQAYYAAQAGLYYAMDQLRSENAAWLTGTASGITYRICSSSYAAAASPSTLCTGNNIIEPYFPSAINYVEMTVGPFNTANNSRQINVTAVYNTSG